jgi:hypothetical protein
VAGWRQPNREAICKGKIKELNAGYSLPQMAKAEAALEV